MQRYILRNKNKIVLISGVLIALGFYEQVDNGQSRTF